MMRRTKRRKREHRQCRQRLLLVLSPALALLGVGTPLWVTSRLWPQQVASSSSTTTTTTTTADACNNNSNICGRCPELIEAAKYYLHYDAQQQQQQQQQHTNDREYKVQMIQLVGAWPNDPAMQNIMQQVFAHNRQVIVQQQQQKQQQQDSIYHFEPVAIVEPPTKIPPSCRHQTFPPAASPAFWKIMAIHQHCTNSNNNNNNSGGAKNTTANTTTTTTTPDLVWFLDGDALVMDATVRVDFLWAWHRQQQQQLDMLFAHGRNGYNSGILLVNCTSPTALQTLVLWHDVALDLLLLATASNNNNSNNNQPEFQNHVRPRWYEQNALHYMLNTFQWRMQGSIANNQNGNNNLQPRVWDKHYAPDYAYLWDKDDYKAMQLFSTQALRTRLRHTTQCALQTFPPTTHNHKNNNRFVYSPGHFILHTAGVPRGQRLEILQRHVTMTSNNNNQQQQQQQPRQTVAQAALAYLQSHAYSYEMNETYLDWDYPD